MRDMSKWVEAAEYKCWLDAALLKGPDFKVDSIEECKSICESNDDCGLIVAMPSRPHDCYVFMNEDKASCEGAEGWATYAKNPESTYWRSK